MINKIFAKKGKTSRKRFPNYKTWCKWKMADNMFLSFINKENDTRTNRENEGTIYG